LQVRQQSDDQDVGASFPLRAIIASLVTVAILAGGFYFYRTASSTAAYPPIVVATGWKDGVYHSLGTALKQVLSSTGKFQSIDILATEGSVENMNLIGNPDSGVDLAIVQGDASYSTNARLLATLYDEVLHILLSKSTADTIKSIYDLEGKRLALGLPGSGTRELSVRVLQHFGIDPGQDIAQSPQEVAAGLADGSIDAAFMLSTIPSPLIATLAAQDDIRFLSLGGAREEGDEAHALELVFPGVKRDTIPRSTYVRLPRQAVHTVSVAAMLVARADLDDEVVRAVTATIFDNRAGASGLEGQGVSVARNIREEYHPALVSMPYHGGAKDYYLRSQPPFYVEYAETLSLLLTLMLAIYSGFIALREWSRRRMKNRVDAYLLQVENLIVHRHKQTLEELLAQQKALEDLRRAAFADLIDERLLADEAFTILQNHLRDELASIQASIAVCSRRP
jgi:uncharacterized protein